MVSRPLLWFFLSIDFNRYVRTCLGTEGTSDAAFRSLHVNNVVPTPVILRRIGQHILGTEGNTQAAALTPLLINCYCSFWHVCAWFGGISKVCSRSTVLSDRESALGSTRGCLWHFVSVLCAAIRGASRLYAAGNLLRSRVTAQISAWVLLK